MTKEEFKSIRKSFALTQEGMARRIGCSVDLVRKIEQGNGQITGPIASCVLLIQENHHLRNELRAYRTGDKTAITNSNKQQRVADLLREKAVIEDKLRKEGDPIEK